MRAAMIFDPVPTAIAPVTAFSFAPWSTIIVPVLLIALARLAWQVFTLRRKVRELTDRDPLTGVASRTGFLAALNREVLQHFPPNGGVSVAVLDCDDFKQINERFGHQVGDSALIEVARVLAQVVSTSGTVGRIWGDAFGICLPNFSEDSARDLLTRAQERLQSEMSSHGWPLTFSIGVSSLSESNACAETLLGDADRLMFEVKRRGRNGIAARGQFPETKTANGQPHDPLASPEFARQP